MTVFQDTVLNRAGLDNIVLHFRALSTCLAGWALPCLPALTALRGLTDWPHRRGDCPGLTALQCWVTGPPARRCSHWPAASAATRPGHTSRPGQAFRPTRPGHKGGTVGDSKGRSLPMWSEIETIPSRWSGIHLTSSSGRLLAPYLVDFSKFSKLIIKFRFRPRGLPEGEQ